MSTVNTPANGEPKSENNKNSGTAPGFEIIFGITALLAVFLYKRK
jgi:hypothetical protein